jgi:hypothetical protein
MAPSVMGIKQDFFFENPVSTVITEIVEGLIGRFRAILTVLSRVITSVLPTTIRTAWQLSRCFSLRVIGFTRHPQPTRFYCMGPLSRERKCFPFVSCQKKILRRQTRVLDDTTNSTRERFHTRLPRKTFFRGHFHCRYRNFLRLRACEDAPTFASRCLRTPYAREDERQLTEDCDDCKRELMGRYFILSVFLFVPSYIFSIL